MDRREFLKSVSAFGVVITVPQLATVQEFFDSDVINPFIIFEEQLVDFDNALSMSATFPDGTRHALTILGRNIPESVKQQTKHILVAWWEEQKEIS